MRNHRIVIRKHGGPEVLEPLEEDAPLPAAGEVRIRVEAAGISAHDLMTRGSRLLEPKRPPYTPGIDAVGVIDAVGDGVGLEHVGRRVATANFTTTSGAYTELWCRPLDEVVPVPDGVDPAEAVCVVVNYLTAHAMLHRGGHLKAGERLLVQGAAGGVGTAALDLGRLAGAELFGTASGHNEELLADFGAAPIDYRHDNVVERIRELTGDGVDVVLDPIGGWSQLWRSYRCLRPGGRLVWFGVAGIRDRGMWVIPQSLLARLLISLLPDGRRAPIAPRADEAWTEVLPGLLEHLAAGELQPVVAARIPLRDAVAAHELLQRGGHRGKIVLVP